MATLVTPGGEDAPARLPPKQREPDAHLVTVRQKCLARIRADREAKHRSRRTQTPHNRAQALLDDVLGRRKRVRDEDYGGDEFTKKLREAVPPDLDPYEPDFHLTPEDEAALMEELEREIRAWDKEIEAEEAIEALTAEAAGLAFEAEELRDAADGVTVPCPCCSDGRLGRRGADLAIACDKCDLALPDQRDGLSLDDVSTSLAATFRAHTQAGCPRSPAFRVDDRTGYPLLCATCDACGYFDLVC